MRVLFLPDFLYFAILARPVRVFPALKYRRGTTASYATDWMLKNLCDNCYSYSFLGEQICKKKEIFTKINYYI